MTEKTTENTLMSSFINKDLKESVTGRKISNKNSLSNTIFIVLDTETTSAATEDKYNKKGDLIENKAKVIELAYSRMSQNGHSSHFEDRFYDPGMRIPPSSMSVHNITDKMVAGKPKIDDPKEIEIIREDIGEFPVLAYNSGFDYKMLPMLQDKKWIDVYKMAVHVWHIGQENEYGQPLTSFKQQELRFWLGLDDKYAITGEAHRADSDIQVTGFIFQEVKKHYLEVLKKPDTLEDFINWVDSAPSYKSIPFGPLKTKLNTETGKFGVSPDDLDVGYLSYLLSKRNPLRESFDGFGVTDYLMAAYIPKLSAKMNLSYDTDFKNVLGNINSLSDYASTLPEEVKAAHRKGNKTKEEVIKDITENTYALEEIIQKLAEVSSHYTSDEDIENAPVARVKVNSVDYNITQGVRANAKKTAARRQNGLGYLDKNKRK